MRNLILFVTQAIVDHPDEVQVREIDRGRRLELVVADEDLGRVIGRRGTTAQAMRTLLRASSRGRGGPDLDIVGRDESGAE